MTREEAQKLGHGDGHEAVTLVGYAVGGWIRVCIECGYCDSVTRLDSYKGRPIDTMEELFTVPLTYVAGKALRHLKRCHPERRDMIARLIAHIQRAKRIEGVPGGDRRRVITLPG